MSTADLPGNGRAPGPDHDLRDSCTLPAAAPRRAASGAFELAPSNMNEHFKGFLEEFGPTLDSAKL